MMIFRAGNTMEKLFLLALVVMTCDAGVPADTQTVRPTFEDTKRLMKDLFKNKDDEKHVRPIEDQSLPVIVAARYTLSSIVNFDESKESLATSGFLSLQWTAPSLAWNEDDYNGLTYTHVPQDYVWKPDVELRNTVSDRLRNNHDNLALWLFSDGTLLWEPVQIIHSTCDVNIKYFPFDTQTCELKFVAWSYSKDFVQFEFIGENPVATDRFEESASWDLIATSASTKEETLDSIMVFKLTLKRKPSFYVMNVLIPILLLSVLTVFVHVLPVSSGERASYAVTVFLAFAVFLTLISDQLPDNSDVLSYLGIYLTIMLTVSTLAVIVTLIQQRLITRNTRSDPLPKYCIVLYNFMQCIRCKTCRKPKKEYRVDSRTGYVYRVPRSEVSWEDFVNTIDFFFFWFSFLTFLITTIIVGFLIFTNT